MDSVQKQTGESQQNITSKKQEIHQRKNLQQHEENQKIFPTIPDHPIINSDVIKDIITPAPISKEKINKEENKILTTTDSMQEFLEIPDYLPSDDDIEVEEDDKS